MLGRGFMRCTTAALLLSAAAVDGQGADNPLPAGQVSVKVSAGCAATQDNCIDLETCTAYITDAEKAKHVYAMGDLHKSGTGWQSNGEGAPYIYYINVCKQITTLPKPSCAGAKGDCDTTGCAAFQASKDGSVCYAVSR